METTENSHLAYLKSCIGLHASDKALSPVSRWLNAKLLEAEEGYLKVEFVVQPEWLNPFGSFHGGMAAAFMDDLIGTTVYSLGLKVQYSTINLNLDYLSFALSGDVLWAECKIVRKGIAVINAEAFIYKRKKLLVKASSNLVNTGAKAY